MKKTNENLKPVEKVYLTEEQKKMAMEYVNSNTSYDEKEKFWTGFWN